jgi:GT2 family glycosyltransferase
MLSVVIPVYRNPVLLDYVLHEAIARLPRSAELLIVDDDAGHDARAVLRRFRKARVVRHEQRRGITAALNTGARAAQGDVLVFMNSDVILGDAALGSLEAAVRQGDGAVGMVGSLLLYPQNGRIQHAGVAVDKWAVTHLYVGARANVISFAQLEERQAITGALFACRRSVYDQLGGFDEGFHDGLEDIDFCLRCGAAGLKNYISAEATSYHFESATRAPYKHVRRTYNYAVFFSRWRGRLTEDLTTYLSRRLRNMDPEFLPSNVTIVNFCSTLNWVDLAHAVADHGINLSATHDLSGFMAESEPIDLYRSVPRFLHEQRDTLCFIVDHFLQLADNHRWFASRNGDDLVIDRHANTVLTTELRGNGPQSTWGA